MRDRGYPPPLTLSAVPLCSASKGAAPGEGAGLRLRPRANVLESREKEDLIGP